MWGMPSPQPTSNGHSLHPKVAADLLVRNTASFEGFNVFKDLVAADRRRSHSGLKEGLPSPDRMQRSRRQDCREASMPAFQSADQAGDRPLCFAQDRRGSLCAGLVGLLPHREARQMFGARKHCGNTESVALKQSRLSGVPAKASQRDCADNECGPVAMDCCGRGSALILPKLQRRSRCCPDQSSPDKVTSLEEFEEGKINTRLARSENSANPHAVANLRVRYNLDLHALCGRVQILAEINRNDHLTAPALPS